MLPKESKFSCKVWIEHGGKPLLGKGGAEILEQIGKERSISKAAWNLGMSYRYVWSYLQKIEKVVGKPIVETHRGGRSGGGGARLTELGNDLLKEYRRVEEYLGTVLSYAEHGEKTGLQNDKKNSLRARVIEVDGDELTARVKVKITIPAVITILAPKKVFRDLNIKAGDEVEAIVKATDIVRVKQPARSSSGA